MNCPLCYSKNIDVKSNITSREISTLYKKKLSISIDDLSTEITNLCECINCSLLFYIPALTGGEGFYNQLQHYDWYYSDDKDEFQYAKDFIKEEDTVLEVGSGKGAFSKHIHSKNYTGLDFSTNAKKLAEKDGITIQNISVEEFSASHNEEFDVVCSFQVLEHVENPHSFLHSQIACLRQGGKLIISVPSEDSLLSRSSNNPLNMPPHHLTRWRDKTLRELTKLFPLEVKEIYHEPVQEIHKLWYIVTDIKSHLWKEKIVEKNVIKKFVSKLIYILLTPLKNRVKIPIDSYGHTVTFIYEKLNENTNP